MRRLIILNPKSRNGTAGQRFQEQRRHWENRLGAFELYETRAAGDATAKVRTVLRAGEVDQVIVAGGDGSINEAFRGYWSDDELIIDPTIPLGIINLGTGGDFFRSVTDASREYEEALVENRFRLVDAGQVIDPLEMTHFFLNIASIGMAGEMLRKLKASRFQNGAPAYFYHSLRTLLAFGPRSVEIELVDLQGQRTTIQRDLLNFFVCNGRFSGGGMEWAPAANLESGTLRVTLIGGRKKWPLVLQSRKLYSGQIETFPGAETFEATEIVVKCPENLSLETDGEIIESSRDRGGTYAFRGMKRVFPLVL